MPFRGVLPSSSSLPGLDYRLQVDWAGDGQFAHAESDVSDELIDVRTICGRDYGNQVYGKSVAGQLSAQLWDDSAKYSRFNSFSPLHELAIQSKRVRLQMSTDSGTTWAYLWGGYLDSMHPRTQRGGFAIVELRAIGILSKLTQGDIDEPMRTDIRTDEAMGHLLESEGISAAERILHQGRTTMARWWAQTNNPLNAVRDIEETEGGFVLEARGGEFEFQDREYRLRGARLRAQVTFSDGDLAGSIPITEPPVSNDTLKDVANVVEVEVLRYTVEPEEVLWTIEPGQYLLPIPPQGIATPIARYPIANLGHPSDHVGVEQWTDPEATTDYTAENTAGDDRTASLSFVVTKTATSMRMAITNTHATDTLTVTKLQARGQALAVASTLGTVQTDQTSIDTYGRRRYSTPPTFITDYQDAENYARTRLTQLAQPHPVVTLSQDAQLSDDMIEAVKTLHVSDRLRLKADGISRLGFGAEMFIESVAHELTRGGRHRTRYVLSSAVPSSFIWVLGKGRLGRTTRLGY